MKIALYIFFCFPDYNAVKKRVYANGKMLRELGYKVVFKATLSKSRVIFDKFKKIFDLNGPSYTAKCLFYIR